MRAIQTSKTDSIGRKYQIMIVSILKNWSSRYSSRYIITFVGIIQSYYAINLILFHTYMIFSNLYLGCIDLLHV